MGWLLALFEHIRLSFKLAKDKYSRFSCIISDEEKSSITLMLALLLLQQG